jgi:hypothetical protein
MNVGKLGKLAPRLDPRTLKLRDYVRLLPVAPDPVDWGKAVKVPWGMDGNDQYGDCFWAMGSHALMTWTGNTGSIFVPTEVQTLAAYSAATGFDPNDPSTDNGTVMLDGLKYLRTTGIAGKKIGAFAAVDPKDHAEVMAALYLFGTLLVGVQFPSDWMDAPVWDVSSSPIEGGHAIPAVKGSASAELLEIVTWGETRTLTFAGFDQNCDELYVTLPPEWINDHGLAPNGLNMSQLAADLSAITA